MVNWGSRGDWDTYSANLRNAPNIAPRDLDLGIKKTARKFSSSQDIMVTLIHITDSYNWSAWFSIITLGVSYSCMSTMSLRRSCHLCGLAPEEQAIDQICIICQRRILMDLLGRCVFTSCSSVSMHGSCHCKTVERMPHVFIVVIRVETELSYLKRMRRLRKTRMMMKVWTVYAGRLMRTDKNLDISTLITRGCYFGTYYLTASTLPLGLATTWLIWTLPTCFPTALCMCLVWWKCRYSQPRRFEWLCIDFFFTTHLLLRLMWLHQFSSDCFLWQVSMRMSFSGWLCCLIQVDLPCIELTEWTCCFPQINVVVIMRSS